MASKNFPLSFTVVRPLINAHTETRYDPLFQAETIGQSRTCYRTMFGFLFSVRRALALRGENSDL